MIKKIFAILLAAAMLLALAACGSSRAGGSQAGDAANSENNGGTGGSAENDTSNGGAGMSGGNTETADTLQRYRDAYAKYDPDTVVLTVNGEDVVWSDYFSWLYSIASQMESYYGTIDWTASLDDTTSYNSYALDYAEAPAVQYVAIIQSAKENGVELSEEDRAEIEAIYQEDVLTYGGSEEAFNQMLSELFIPLDYYYYMAEATYYYNNFFEQTFGELGEKLSDEDVLAFTEDYGYMRAKHILYKTVDDSMNPLPDDQIAERKAAAEAALAKLQACATQEDLLTLFDEIMFAESEDAGLINNPGGYYFTEGEMIPEFESAAMALNDYEMSGIVEGAYGYHIILRLPADPEDIIDSANGISLRYAAASALYGSMVADIVDSAEVVYKNGFEQLDLNELFA